jgi:hypothetical protein
MPVYFPLIQPILLGLLSFLLPWPADEQYPKEDCQITSVRITNTSLCRNRNTQEWEDDWFYIDVEVHFQQRPDSGQLILSGPLLLEAVRIPVSDIPVDSTRLAIKEVHLKAVSAQRQIALTAHFSARPECKRTNRQAGQAREQCSVCTGPRSTIGQRYPKCWPQQSPDDPCSQSINYAPDPDYNRLTPIRYMKTIVHVFQKEDPEHLDEYVVHPSDPGNFTEAHMDIIRSWFRDSLGANGILRNLCDDPTDGSPHIKDSRLRLLNTGTVGQDVFFHPDNKGWGTGYGKCGGSHRYWYKVERKYITRPDTANPYYDVLKRPETQDAFHVFITGGSWGSEPPGDPRIPDENDCYYHCAGGMTLSMGCRGGRPPAHPAQAMFGTYYVWQQHLTPGKQNCETDYKITAPELGGSMLGEIFHVLTLDHLSPLQAHKRHPEGVDGCLDTPLRSKYNRLDCSYETRCALTECQIGRIQHFFADLRPSFERFPDGQGGFNAERPVCQPVEEDLVIPAGAAITWKGNRELRSGVVVQPGARLSITCELGLPASAQIVVEPGGELVIDGARLYTPCPDAPWAGITAAGRVFIQPGSVLNGAALIKTTGTGQIIARQSQFEHCGFGPTLFICGQDGNSCE